MRPVLSPFCELVHESTERCRETYLQRRGPRQHDDVAVLPSVTDASQLVVRLSPP